MDTQETRDERLELCLRVYVGLSSEEARERLARAKADFAEDFETNPAYAAEWKMTKVIETQELYTIATELYDTDMELRDAVGQFLTRFARSLHHLRGESGSTSGATNLVESIRTATRAKVYSELVEYLDYERAKLAEIADTAGVEVD